MTSAQPTKSASDIAADVIPPPTTYQSARGFQALVVTQFFGAANDNVLKVVLSYMVIEGPWKGQLGEGGQGIVAACLTAPFILLSGLAGQYADRHSKRYVSVIVKLAEIPIAIVAMIGFWLENLWITLATLIALACQSAFFGPAKYGMIPDLVPSSSLSRANGMINMMTNIAIIVGTLVAGVVGDYYSPLLKDGQSPVAGIPWLPGAVLIFVALAGLGAVSFLTPLPPGNPTVKYDLNLLKGYLQPIREMSKSSLLLIALAGAMFYFVAALAMLIIPEYTSVLKDYNVSRGEVSVLLGILGLAVGIGSALAGLISGSAIRPGLVPLGATGLTLFFFLLGVVHPTLPDLPPYWRIAFSPHAALILGAGISAGFYVIPLQALLQRLSSNEARGRILGAANGITFGFLTTASLLYWVIRPLFKTESGEHPEKIFFICSGLMLLVMIVLLSLLRSSGLTLKKVA